MLRPSPNHGTQRLPNDDDMKFYCHGENVMKNHENSYRPIYGFVQGCVHIRVHPTTVQLRRHE